MSFNRNHKWDNEILQKEALKYKTRAEFQKKNRPMYRAAARYDILDLICSHMNQQLTYWTKAMLCREALKYKTRAEFKIKMESAYNISIRRGILDEICQHMPKHVSMKGNNNPRFKWTREKIVQEARLFNNRGIFKKSSFAYQAAQKLGILDSICSHMNRYDGYSDPEKKLFDIIKEKYPKTQKLRCRKINIVNKPHITGFDIDIYIPELRKGIEFDGLFHHSVDGLKRGRPNWPEEDLTNYHKIKDEYFISRDIKVLHIKEEDWNRNKKECIERCLEFLSI